MRPNWIFQHLRRALRWRHEERRRCYRACFLGSDGMPTEDAKAVLSDLRRFCKVTHSSFVPGDPHATSLNEGRREVWNRLIEHLYLSDETISSMVEAAYPEEAEGFGNE